MCSFSPVLIWVFLYKKYEVWLVKNTNLSLISLCWMQVIKINNNILTKIAINIKQNTKTTELGYEVFTTCTRTQGLQSKRQLWAFQIAIKLFNQSWLSQILYERGGPWSRRLSPVSGWESLNTPGWDTNPSQISFQKTLYSFTYPGRMESWVSLGVFFPLKRNKTRLNKTLKTFISYS